MPGFLRNSRQCVQFRLRFDIEACDSGTQRQRHLVAGLADAGKCDAFARHAGRQRAPQFAFGDDIHACAAAGERADHGLIGIGLHRVANSDVQTREGVAEYLVVPLDGRRRIAIEGRADFVGQRGDVDVFGKETPVAIVEMPHGLEKRIEDKCRGALGRRLGLGFRLFRPRGRIAKQAARGAGRSRFDFSLRGGARLLRRARRRFERTSPAAARQDKRRRDADENSDAGGQGTILLMLAWPSTGHGIEPTRAVSQP